MRSVQNARHARTSKINLLVLFCCSLMPAALASPINAEDWPQFRGPNCSGVSLSKMSLPTKFSDEDNVAWTAKVGDGIGCPVVAAGRVFTSAMVGEQKVALFCFDAKSGKQLWERSWETGPLPEIHKMNSQSATTPAADAKRVYFYFSTLGMLALDATTGDDAWKVKLPVPYFVFKWGAGMSPTLFKNMVLFCQDDDLNPAFYAINKNTGKILWKDDRSDMAVNYSHPVICETKSGPEIVLGGTGVLIGYDPKTGTRIWHAKTLLRNMKTTPVSHNGVVYISLQSSGIANQWLATADQSDTGNKDGKLSKAEMQAFVGDVKIPAAFFNKFDRGDVNKDGLLEGAELDKAFLDPKNFAGARFDAEDPANQFIQAIRGGGRGDVTKTHVLWNHDSRAPDHIVSPLVVDGRMLIVKGGGIASCYDTSGGEAIWHQKRIQNIGEYFASPIYGDGKIYVAGENGNVVVLKNGPKLEVLAKNDMGESILGTPAIADGRLFIRTRTKLICVTDQSK